MSVTQQNPGGAGYLFPHPYIIIPRFPRVSAAGIPSWWEGSGAVTSGITAAWTAKGAASQAASYVNLVNPGTYDLSAAGSPSWATGTGWTLNGTTDAFSTGIAPSGTMTWIVRWANVTNTGSAMGYIHLFARRHWCNPKPGSTVAWGSGNTFTNAGTGVAAGTGCIARNGGGRAYLNGSDVGTSFSAWSGSPDAGAYIWLGGNYNDNANSLGSFLAGDIIAAAAYNFQLNATQVAAVHTELAAL